jgi:hypothetical protein
MANNLNESFLIAKNCSEEEKNEVLRRPLTLDFFQKYEVLLLNKQIKKIKKKLLKVFKKYFLPVFYFNTDIESFRRE